MKKQTARRRKEIASGAGVTISFIALVWMMPGGLELWQQMAITGLISILYLTLILWENQEHKPRTIVIKVKAWDNQEVRIRALTASEEVK